MNCSVVVWKPPSLSSVLACSTISMLNFKVTLLVFWNQSSRFMWNIMHFTGYKHRTRKEEKMQRQQNEIVVTMLLKYIMEITVKDCKFQQDKMKQPGNVVLLMIINPSLRSHASPVHCWQGDACGVEQYLGTRDKIDDRTQWKEYVCFRALQNMHKKIST